MSDVTISALPAVTTVVPGTDVLPLVSNSGATTTKATPNEVVKAVLPAPGPIGATTADTGAFTDLSSSGTISGTGFSNYLTTQLASPPAIGGTAPNTGKFTKVTMNAGTNAIAPINMTAGTNLTTATAGAVEYDGDVAYFTPTANCRGVVPAEQFITLTSTYTLTSQTAAQKLFNSSANGTLTLPVGTFSFECEFNLSSMSATSGSFGFALGGGATFTQTWMATANKPAALATATAPQTTYNTAANTTLATATTNTVGYARITGSIRVTGAGTIIPQVSLGVAAAAVVGLGSYFRIKPMGSSTVTTVGNWS